MLGALPGAGEGLCYGPLPPHPATQAPLVQEPLFRAAGEPEGVGPCLQGARFAVAVCAVSGADVAFVQLRMQLKASTCLVCEYSSSAYGTTRLQ